MRVYLDNAATTPLDKEVLEAMLPYLTEHFGNPSSIHGHGRLVRSAIERSRKKVAELLNTSPSEIFFTSGGTEADNTALVKSIEAYGLTHVITSKIEHHAVLHTLEYLHEQGKIALTYVELDEKGHVNLDHLEAFLKDHPGKALVSLMHANNEIGNLNDIEKIGQLAKEYKAVFHTDTVQAVGHYRHDLQVLNLNMMVGAAHKFHGPKGVGFLHINHNCKIHPFIHGGAQERNMRGGTENVPGIIGLAKALELAYEHMDEHRKHMESLKESMIRQLSASVEGITFNGDSANLANSLYTVLSISLPPNEDNDMLLFSLDIEGVSASGGSACSSGSHVGSHVLGALGVDPMRGNIRFSFSRFTTQQDIDFTVQKLTELVAVRA
ncbi:MULTISPECIES: cysteine desulfurase family protein [unclassified Imperialibacter]|uniref:cysteine desulfurase family protein n=1 Tax=unclassified Imperialibacter TaxID=2629706 RepID=UPI00125573C7|nr:MULTISPECIES: cysteine desulfurase family protein [unclassified Imperialibacter]CAD5270253.1 Cysteine desulfurase IscS [Imperialibacter sp. 89]CAD5298098.1 Cysteine desulfurase IscS [Imperialibacter sp. 75]VVT34287.1 Cysteine desulfurase IscS [Imperialibacter sp. EC-SDR9]